MSLNDKYRVHNKPKSNKLLCIYLLIALFLIFSWSLARYISNSKVTFTTDVAKWSLKVNGVQITESTTKIKNEIKLIPTENVTEEGIIKQGQKGYLDIEIDPQYTEVSLKYKFKIDMTNLPSHIKLMQYSLNNLEEKSEMPEDNIFEGEILLSGKERLESSDIRNYRIYWEWIDDDTSKDEAEENINENQEYKIKVNLQVEQMI